MQQLRNEKFALLRFWTILGVSFSFHALMQIAPENHSYQANRYDENLKLCSSSLLKVLDDQQNLGSGFYSSSVKKVLVDFHGKKLNFALKSFKNIEDLNYALQMHQRVKKAKLPTWNTYRHLDRTNDVVMTLGNADGSLVFSPHNASEDREKAKSEHVFEVMNNKEALFEQAWEVMEKSAEKNLVLPWDSYFLKSKDENLSLIIGDLDQVCVWKRPPALSRKVEKNIEEFFRLLSEVKDYFGVSYGSEFFSFLQRKQQEGDSYLENIDILNLYRKCDSFYGLE